jgi:hypothetical protein
MCSCSVGGYAGAPFSRQVERYARRYTSQPTSPAQGHAPQPQGQPNQAMCYRYQEQAELKLVQVRRRHILDRITARSKRCALPAQPATSAITVSVALGEAGAPARRAPGAPGGP